MVLLYLVFYLFILQCEHSFVIHDTFVLASLPAVTESMASPDEMGECF